MKPFAMILMAAALLAGCASLEETYYLDREFGQASQEAWDQQVAYPDYRHAEKTPENIQGINSEEIMEVHNRNFAEKTQPVNIFQLGVVQ